MKKFILIASVLFVFFVQALSAQTSANVSIFNRLLIFNDKNEVLVVRVKDSKVWLTPGFYQDDKTLLKEGLNNSAAAFGLKISEPRLQGVFVLKRIESKNLSYRNMFVVKTKDAVSKKPDVVDKIKWVKIGKTNKITTFPHIDKIIRQVTFYPDTIWGGSLSSYREDGKPQAKILEDFYPLFSSKQRR